MISQKDYDIPFNPYHMIGGYCDNYVPHILKCNGKRVYNVKRKYYDSKDDIFYKECESYTDYRLHYTNINDIIIDKYGNLIL